jgi:tetratricopeptide (TPR) repeat protein
MKKLFTLFIAICLLCGCTKDYLEKRRDKSLLVPTTLDDYQKLLDAAYQSNLNTVAGLNEIASDNFATDDATLLSLDPVERNSYLWEKDIFQGASANDWNYPYQAIFVSNVVLDGLSKPEFKDDPQGRPLRGTALFYRANALYTLAQEFALPYDPQTAATAPGIPIRLTADVNKISDRGTLQETFRQITADLTLASDLLPQTVAFKNRPTKAAALAMLARVDLTMANYTQALDHAQKALQSSGRLIDYNTLAPSGFDSPFPMVLPNGNDEALCLESLVGYSFFVEPAVFVNEPLYQSYNDNDLRKTCFFADQGNGGINYVGSYSGDFSTLFGGPATDELYLISAECKARQGQTNEALKDLNALLVTRWRSGTFMPFKANSAEDALRIILRERRKELIGRGLRWGDLRRLNQDERFKEVVTKIINGQTISLLPNDKRYTFPIPAEEISRSGIPQNER